MCLGQKKKGEPKCRTVCKTEHREAFKHQNRKLHVADPKIHANRRKLQTVEDKIGTNWKQNKANHEEQKCGTHTNNYKSCNTPTESDCAEKTYTIQRLKQVNDSHKTHKSNKPLNLH